MEPKANISKTANIIKNAVLVVSTVVVAGLAYFTFEQREENQQLQDRVQQLDQYNEEALTSFVEIERNLMDIREREGMVIQGLTAEELESIENPQKRIKREITAIEGLIQENKALISQLKVELGDKDEKIASFNSSMDQLEGRMFKYKKQTAELKEEKEFLQKNLAHVAAEGDALQKELATKDMDIKVKEKLIDLQAHEIQQMDYEMRSAYYTVGTFHELKQVQVVEREGGILGLGTTKVLQKDFNRDRFIRIDNTDYTSIPIFAKDVEMVSNHDSDSYELIKAKDGSVKWLKITNPAKFWENTKYLVVIAKGALLQS